MMELEVALWFFGGGGEGGAGEIDLKLEAKLVDWIWVSSSQKPGKSLQSDRLKQSSSVLAFDSSSMSIQVTLKCLKKFQDNSVHRRFSVLSLALLALFHRLKNSSK
jgi:hypothetical protein